MKTFYGLVAYAAIGGLVATLFDNTVRDKCGHGMETGLIFYTTLAWPAVPVIVMFSNAEAGEIQCRKETK